MGNCVFKGIGESKSKTLYDKDDTLIRVVTPNGAVLELNPPVFSDFITDEFPGHVIYDTINHRHSSSSPLFHGEQLFPGNIYYLFPLSTASTVSAASTVSTTSNVSTALNVSNDSAASNVSNVSAAPCSPIDQSMTPYRISFGKTPVRRAVRAVRNSGGSGCEVWKVKLVISSEHLAEILGKDVETEALVESVRTVAKCGGYGGRGSTALAVSRANSDKLSVSSSFKRRY